MLTRRALTDVYTRFLQYLLDAGYPPQRAMLYGSYAKGKPHAYSDVDVAVWMKDPLPKHWTDVPALVKAVSSSHPISPKFYDPNDDDPFIEVIERTGIEIDLDFLLTTTT